MCRLFGVVAGIMRGDVQGADEKVAARLSRAKDLNTAAERLRARIIAQAQAKRDAAVAAGKVESEDDVLLRAATSGQGVERDVALAKLRNKFFDEEVEIDMEEAGAEHAVDDDYDDERDRAEVSSVVLVAF